MTMNEQRGTIAYLLAEKFHNTWLDEFTHSGKQERIKTLNGFTFNIAVSWNLLHEQWKVFQSEQSIKYVENINFSMKLEEMAEEIHKVWMKENPWAIETNPELFVDYFVLPETEKQKDRAIALIISDALILKF